MHRFLTSPHLCTIKTRPVPRLMAIITFKLESDGQKVNPYQQTGSGGTKRNTCLPRNGTARHVSVKPFARTRRRGMRKPLRCMTKPMHSCTSWSELSNRIYRRPARRYRYSVRASRSSYVSSLSRAVGVSSIVRQGSSATMAVSFRSDAPVGHMASPGPN